jgi:hypothetical protein
MPIFYRIFVFFLPIVLSVNGLHAQLADSSTKRSVNSPAIVRSDSIMVDPGEKKKIYAALYYELAGNGVELSYNLDFRFFSHLSVKIGYGAYTENGPHDFGVLITMVHYLFFDRTGHIEIGLGTVTELNTAYCGSTVLPNSCDRIKGTAFLGFRYQPYWGGFTARIGYTPFFNFHEYRSSAGLSVGISFF